MIAPSDLARLALSDHIDNRDPSRRPAYDRHIAPRLRHMVPILPPRNNDAVTAWAVLLGANTVKRLAKEWRCTHHKASAALTRACQRGAIHQAHRENYQSEIVYAVVDGFLPDAPIPPPERREK